MNFSSSLDHEIRGSLSNSAGSCGNAGASVEAPWEAIFRRYDRGKARKNVNRIVTRFVSDRGGPVGVGNKAKEVAGVAAGREAFGRSFLMTEAALPVDRSLANSSLYNYFPYACTITP